MPAAAAAAARREDSANMLLRLESEQSFNAVVTLWPHIDYFRKHKLFQGGKANFRRLLALWYGMVLFTNLHTCANGGSHVTGCFRIEPPTVRDYLRSANMGCMLGQ